jgi:hypothetical protein
MTGIGVLRGLTDENPQPRLNSPVLSGFREYFFIRRVADLFLEGFSSLFHFHRYLSQDGRFTIPNEMMALNDKSAGAD